MTRPVQSGERDTAGRCSARLQTLIGAGSSTGEFHALLNDARQSLGNDHPMTLEIEYQFELRRDQDRSAAESMIVWSDLRQRSENGEPAAARTAMAIRMQHVRQLRRCGRPEDLDRIVALCRDEVRRRPEGTDPRARGQAHAALALVLRDRAWFAAVGPTHPGYDAAADLAEAAGLIDQEVERRTRACDAFAAVNAQLIRAEVLLAEVRHDADPARAGRALALAEELVRLPGGEFDVVDQLPRPHVLLAESLAAVGREWDARRVARLAYALQAGSAVFDPARPLLTLAVSQRHDAPAQALVTAQTALEQRRVTFAAESLYVAEAEQLVSTLA